VRSSFKTHANSGVGSFPNGKYKISLTPITLKNIGSKADLLRCLNRDSTLDAVDGREHGGPAYAVVRLGADGNPQHTQRLLEKLLRDLQNQVPDGLEYGFIR
jgi:hypothetical protein